MKLGIIGLSKVGKTTLFNTLTASRQSTDKFAASSQANVGVATVVDERLERLRELYQPRRYVPATTEYVDIPGMRKGDGPTGYGSETLDLPQLRVVDALVHVVRAFEDAEIVHGDGRLDPGGDMVSVDLELILADHELVGRRLERLEQAAKRGLSDDEKREERLLREIVLPALEGERPLRELELGQEDEKRLRGFQFLSAKPMLVVVNVGEDEVSDTDPESLNLSAGPGVEIVVISAPIEEEISRLDADEQAAFLEDLGLGAPSVVRVIRASYELLGLLSFFTVGEDEVRAWTVRAGTRAREAAGAIHSDIERGFIRAEVVVWEDLLRLGSLSACRDQGLLRLEGKEYEVKDGDVVHFRFNV